MARNRLTFVSLAVIGLLALCAIAAPLLAPRDPSVQELPSRLETPRAGHWLGTDELGRDELSRIVFGGRISFAVAVGVVGLSLAAGAVFGSLAGFYGGTLDYFLNRILINSLLAFPGILLALAFVAFLGPGIGKLILALSLTGWIGYARLIRGEILKLRELEFVHAARALGVREWRLLTLHIWPHVLAPLTIQVAVGLAGAILSEATLSFLGLGVPPPTPSWGAMLNDGRAHLMDSPHLVVFPALAVMAVILSFNFLGDALRDRMDPRLRREMARIDARSAFEEISAKDGN